MKNQFLLKGCKEHNLRNLTISIPKEKIVTVTGISGSGKSSLAFYTLYAEAKARFLEQLAPEMKSLYKLIKKPQVDSISGLTPALGMSRVWPKELEKITLSTYTDLYDLLAELYSKVGKVIHPKTGQPLTRYTRAEIVEEIYERFSKNAKLQILATIDTDSIQDVLKRGFIRFLSDGVEYDSESEIPQDKPLEVVIDRLKLDTEARLRLMESLETALQLGGGVVTIQEGKKGKRELFSEIFYSPDIGLSFAPLDAEDFKYRLKKGACPHCKGTGKTLQISEKLPELESCFEENVYKLFSFLPKATVEQALTLYGKDSFTPAFLHGAEEWTGMNKIIQHTSPKKTPDFIQWKTCSHCHGRKLKPEALLVKVDEKAIDEIEQLSVSELLEWVQTIKFSGKDQRVASELLPEIQRRLELLVQAGLHYLELNRPLSTLSYGERGRTQLASLLGAKFSGLLYILDEPSLGLHPQDVKRLKELFLELKKQKNHLVIVEHQKELIELSDHLIEMGPGAGKEGGIVIFEGSVEEMKHSKTPTGIWLKEKSTLPPAKNKKKTQNLFVKNASLHHLKNLSLQIPLDSLVVFAGVSGSGKSSLAIDFIGKELKEQSGLVTSDIPFETINLIQEIDVKPTPRSTVATFAGLFDPIRKLFAETKLASSRGWSASRFSLNVRGGRCEACKGMGVIKVPFSMLEDLTIPCDVCQGSRYSFDTLQVTWKGLNIAELLSLTTKEALTLFDAQPQLKRKLSLMCELGLDYLPLGESLTDLSGGELQRLKLVRELIDHRLEPTLYILDEPSKGLHFQDIQKLIQIFHRLKEAGHSLLIIEHELNLIAHADWVIELGPEAGPKGGELLFEGPPQKLIEQKTATARALQGLFC